jgi:rubrerythrin
MTDLVSAIKGLGGKFGKGMVVELFLQWYEDELVDQFKQILDGAGVTSESIKDYVLNNVALPIPPEAFAKMKGIEDYLTTIEESRIFTWLYQARPDLGQTLMEMGDAGAEYVVRFKLFVIDSIKNSRKESVEPEKAEEAPEKPKAEETPEDEENPQDIPLIRPGSVKFTGDLEEKPAKEAQRATEKTKKVTCDQCGAVRYGTPEEAAKWAQEPCPTCGK